MLYDKVTNCDQEATSSKTIIDCEKCKQTFASKTNLRKHLKQFHPEIEIIYDKCKQICGICQKSLPKITDLYKHIQKDHVDIHLNFQEKEFCCREDFEEWKMKIEKESQSMFVKHSGSNKNNDKTTIRYYCHRSGVAKVSEKRKRHLKCSGSVKSNVTCPANIKYVETNVQDAIKIDVLYQSTHVGHKVEVGRLRLSVTEKNRLASLLNEGVPSPKILSDVQKEYSPTQRYGLTTKQDLRNISRKFNIHRESRLHSDDAVSVDLLVKKLMMEENCNPILIYKPVGIQHDDFPYISKEEFLLGIMSEPQEKLLQLYGNSCIMVDSTHGTNQYGLQLTTLMVNDSNHEGFPVALFYSVSVSEKTMCAFFESIKKRILLKTQIFMSDDDSSFFNAWQKTFENDSKHLICAWHVLRSWTRNLNSKVKDVDKRKVMLSEMKNILQEVDETSFKKLCQNFIQKYSCNDICKEFVDYFQTYYISRATKWAYCYRVGCAINTNMKLERWHSEIKYEESGSKVMKRLDSSILLIMRAISKKIMNQIISLERGKLTTRIFNVRKRHSLSENMEKENYSVIEINSKEKFLVQKPGQNSIKTYEINYNKKCNCSIRCNECNICIHSYICTCIDFSVRFQICKHIHFVCRDQKLRNESPQNDDLIIYVSSQDVVRDELKDLVSNTVVITSSKKDFQQEKSKLIAKLAILESITNETNIQSILSDIDSLISRHSHAISKLPTSLPNTHKVPSNKNIKPQLRLPSRPNTKSKNKIS